ncbi:hypothetical protein [Bradyrhizobium sp.]|uniref:hypothetical protein n=1 Tax=Bradyrhizobium sp. TaxID=376 RepID=UPI003C3A96E8
MIAVSRRTVLGFLSAAGAMSLGAGFLWVRRPETLIKEIVARRFPGVKISPGGIAALTRDLEQARFQEWGRRIALEAGVLAAGIVGIDALARWRISAAQFSQLERKVVTFLVLGSDLLDVKDPKTELVTYTAMPAMCPNRFAQYDSP